MKFKTEVCLLLLAIGLFVSSSYFYSYQSDGEVATLSLASFPYRLYAMSFVGFGSVLTLAASISFSRKNKTH